MRRGKGAKDINGEAFLLYIEKVLVPTLQPGDIIIIDNLDSHKGRAVPRAIRAAGARLFYLPKFSPDLNPIEQFFFKFKHWLRKAAQRTTEAVYDAIAPDTRHRLTGRMRQLLRQRRI